jgi:hypothetical protein
MRMIHHALLMFALLGTSVSSFGADLATPGLADLRQRFREGQAPRIEDLHPGRPWQCAYISARNSEGNPFGQGGAYRFARAPGHASGISVKGGALLDSWEFTSSALVLHKATNFSARSSNGTASPWRREKLGTDRVRVGVHGELLVELDLPCEGLGCLMILTETRALDGPLAMVIGYRECRLEE